MIGAALGAIAAVLDAAERHFRQGDAVMVDRQHANLNARRQRVHRLERRRIGIGRQTVIQAIGLGHHLIDGGETLHQGDRAERLVIHRAHIGRHAGQHGRLEEIADIADALAAGGNRRALGHRVGNQPFHRRNPARIGQRAHRHTFVQPVANLELVDAGDQLFHEFVMHIVLHQETGGGDADLAGIAEFVGGEDDSGGIQIGIVENHRRRMPAKFHRHPLHMRTGQGGQMLAHHGRAGEGQLADNRMRNQIFADRGRHAEDQIDHARRHTGIQPALHIGGQRGRGFFRPLDDDRTPRRQRAADFAVGLVDREVPRAERRHRADRLLDHQLLNVLRTRRHHTPISAAGLFGEPFDHIGGERGFHLGFAERLALLHRHQTGDGIHAGAQNLGRLAHDLAAVIGSHPAPNLEALLHRDKRTVEIGDIGMRHRAVDLAGGGVGNVEGLAGLARTPIAIDEQLNGRIHRLVLPNLKLGAAAPIHQHHARGTPQGRESANAVRQCALYFTLPLARAGMR